MGNIIDFSHLSFVKRRRAAAVILRWTCRLGSSDLSLRTPILASPTPGPAWPRESTSGPRFSIFTLAEAVAGRPQRNIRLRCCRFVNNPEASCAHKGPARSRWTRGPSNSPTLISIVSAALAQVVAHIYIAVCSTRLHANQLLLKLQHTQGWHLSSQTS